VRALGRNGPEEFNLRKSASGAFRYGTQRILGDMHGEAGGLREQAVETAKERTTAGQHETAID
jgi:hypothetical protein